MKKIFLTAAIAFSCAATSAIAQSPEFSLSNDKKELKEDKRAVSKEEKVVRKEDRAIRHTEVTYWTRDQFQNDFPGAANPVFRKGNTFEEVAYSLDGQHFIAYYDNESQLVGTTTVKQLGDLPADAQSRISKKYIDKGYSVARVILFDDNEYSGTDMWMYDQPFNDQDVYFVELKKAGNTIVLQADTNGVVSFFKKL